MDLPIIIWSVWFRPSVYIRLLLPMTKTSISAPLMSRFAVIEIPDYTTEEKEDDFLTDLHLPKVLKRMGMKREECIVTPEGLDAVVRTLCKYYRYP